jgi:LPXTG-motif cell wall-anchored protein
VEQTEAPAQYRRESERAEQERQTWWLAGIGLITLLISMGVFLLGRKRARHA